MTKVSHTNPPQFPPVFLDHQNPQDGNENGIGSSMDSVIGNPHNSNTVIWNPRPPDTESNNSNSGPGRSSGSTSNNEPTPYSNQSNKSSDTPEENSVSLFLTRTRGYQAPREANIPQEAPAPETQTAQNDRTANTKNTFTETSAMRSGTMANEANGTQSTVRSDGSARYLPETIVSAAKPGADVGRPAAFQGEVVPTTDNRASAMLTDLTGKTREPGTRFSVFSQTSGAEKSPLLSNQTANQMSMRAVYDLIDMRIMPKWLLGIASNEFAMEYVKGRRRLDRSSNVKATARADAADLLEPIAFTGQLVDD